MYVVFYPKMQHAQTFLAHKQTLIHKQIATFVLKFTHKKKNVISLQSGV